MGGGGGREVGERKRGDKRGVEAREEEERKGPIEYSRKLIV